MAKHWFRAAAEGAICVADAIVERLPPDDQPVVSDGVSARLDDALTTRGYRVVASREDRRRAFSAARLCGLVTQI